MGNQSRESSEKAQRLRAAARSNDGFFSTFILRKISRLITSVLVETRITPNVVTSFSIAVGFVAAAVTSQGNLIIGALLLLISLIFDCVDGEIARYRGQFSALGAWLDALADRVKEFLFVSALIYSADDDGLWIYGVAIIILQTARHLSDYNFVRVQSLYESPATPKPDIVASHGPIYWVKKVINLPIGERWLLLALLPLLISIKSALQAILILGIISFGYVILSRLRRISQWERRKTDVQFLIEQRDTLLPIRVPAGRLSWSVPSLLRALEFCGVLIILGANSPTNFWLFFAIAMWHYTNLYDALQGRAVRLKRAGLFLAGRIALCLLAQVASLENEIAILLTMYLLALILLRGRHNGAKEVA